MADFKSRQRQKDNSKPATSAKKSRKAEVLPEKTHFSTATRPSTMTNASTSDIPFTPKNMLFLQRTIGNRAVGLQAKLKIGRPNDQYEQEADRVAEQVMRMPDPRVLQRQPLEENEASIQAKIAGDVISEETPVISAGVQSLQGGGRQLSGPERSFFEPRFGVDFSNVRVHNDGRAANLARSVNARAFTFGQDVVFGAGEHAPDTLAGRKLLAHELTHVVQQNGSLPKDGANRPNRSAAWGACMCPSVDSPMQHGKPQNLVQQKASAVGQPVEGMAGGLKDEEMALAQYLSQSGQPMIQRSTAWKAGAVHETINLAHMVLNGSPTPITWHMLNGTKMTTAAAAVGAINSPTVSTAKSGATWKAKVTAVPLNTGSFDETVLAKGPWNQVVPKATVGARFGLAVCTGKGDTAFRAKGDPNDNHVFTANRGHEDHHASDHQAAFNAKIGTWDTKVTEAKNKATEFAGANPAAATANLWTAMGGTPADVAKAYRTDGFTRGGAFHATPNGGPMSVASPHADKTCATSSVKVKNPFK